MSFPPLLQIGQLLCSFPILHQQPPPLKSSFSHSALKHSCALLPILRWRLLNDKTFCFLFSDANFLFLLWRILVQCPRNHIIVFAVYTWFATSKQTFIRSLVISEEFRRYQKKGDLTSSEHTVPMQTLCGDKHGDKVAVKWVYNGSNYCSFLFWINNGKLLEDNCN